jgi:hypothetical protein
MDLIKEMELQLDLARAKLEKSRMENRGKSIRTSFSTCWMTQNQVNKDNQWVFDQFELTCEISVLLNKIEKAIESEKNQ